MTSQGARLHTVVPCFRCTDIPGPMRTWRGFVELGCTVGAGTPIKPRYYFNLCGSGSLFSALRPVNVSASSMWPTRYVAAGSSGIAQYGGFPVAELLVLNECLVDYETTFVTNIEQWACVGPHLTFSITMVKRLDLRLPYMSVRRSPFPNVTKRPVVAALLDSTLTP